MPKLMVGNAAVSPATVFNIESVPGYIPLDKGYSIDQNGKLVAPTAKTSYDTGSGVTDIGDNVLQMSFANNSAITSCNFSEVSTISGANACKNMFRNANNLATITFPELTSVTGASALYRICITEDDFSGSSISTGNKLTSVSFPKLTTVSGNQAFYQAFGYYGWSEDPSAGPQLTTVDLDTLEVASGNYCFGCAFEQLGSVTTLYMSNIKTAGVSAFSSFMAQNPNFAGEMVFDKLTSVDSFAFMNAFAGSKITKFGAPNLTEIRKKGAFRGSCDSCKLLTELRFDNLEIIDTSLETVSQYDSAVINACGCTSLTEVRFPKLKTINANRCFYYGFTDNTSLTDIYFPALTSTGFGSYTTQFDKMLVSTSNCTVHFPSNLQSVIGSWSSVTNGFDGTNTTVLFDLPATI